MLYLIIFALSTLSSSLSTMELSYDTCLRHYIQVRGPSTLRYRLWSCPNCRCNILPIGHTPLDYSKNETLPLFCHYRSCCPGTWSQVWFYSWSSQAYSPSFQRFLSHLVCSSFGTFLQWNPTLFDCKVPGLDCSWSVWVNNSNVFPLTVPPHISRLKSHLHLGHIFVMVCPGHLSQCA